VNVNTPWTSARDRFNADAIMGIAGSGTQPNASCRACRITSVAPFKVGVLRDDLGAARGIPWFVNWRHPRAFAQA